MVFCVHRDKTTTTARVSVSSSSSNQKMMTEVCEYCGKRKGPGGKWRTETWRELRRTLNEKDNEGVLPKFGDVLQW